MADILVLYYSRHGSVANLAAQIARGINGVAGATARLRTVPPVTAENGPRLPDVPDEGPPYATNARPCRLRRAGTRQSDAFRQHGGAAQAFPGRDRQRVAVRRPARQASRRLHLDEFTLHGGQESTLLTMALPLLHHGMVLVGVPYAEPATGHDAHRRLALRRHPLRADRHGDTTLSADEASIAQHLGRRVAEAALRLEGWETVSSGPRRRSPDCWCSAPGCWSAPPAGQRARAGRAAADRPGLRGAAADPAAGRTPRRAPVGCLGGDRDDSVLRAQRRRVSGCARSRLPRARPFRHPDRRGVLRGIAARAGSRSESAGRHQASRTLRTKGMVSRFCAASAARSSMSSTRNRLPGPRGVRVSR